jgi:hypothetical protein
MAALASNGSSLHSLPQYWSIDTTCLGRQLLGIDERARRALRTTNSHPDYPKPFERHWLNTRNRSIDGISWCADSYLVGDIKKPRICAAFCCALECTESTWKRTRHFGGGCLRRTIALSWRSPPLNRVFETSASAIPPLLPPQ